MEDTGQRNLAPAEPIDAENAEDTQRRRGLHNGLFNFSESAVLANSAAPRETSAFPHFRTDPPGRCEALAGCPMLAEMAAEPYGFGIDCLAIGRRKFAVQYATSQQLSFPHVYRRYSAGISFAF